MTGELKSPDVFGRDVTDGYYQRPTLLKLYLGCHLPNPNSVSRKNNTQIRRWRRKGNQGGSGERN